MPVPAPNPVAENYVFGPFLLHHSEWGHWVLYGPETPFSGPFEFLDGFGVTNQWTCEWETVGDVLVTHLFHPDYFSD